MYYKRSTTMLPISSFGGCHLVFIHIDTDAHTTIFVIKCLYFLVATSYCRRGDNNPAPSGTAFAQGPNIASDSRSISEICRNYYQECVVGTTTFYGVPGSLLYGSICSYHMCGTKSVVFAYRRMCS